MCHQPVSDPCVEEQKEPKEGPREIEENHENDSAQPGNLQLSVHESATPEQKVLPPLKTGEIELTNEETRKLRPDAARLSVSERSNQSAGEEPKNGEQIVIDDSLSEPTSNQADSQKKSNFVTQQEYSKLQSENENLKEQLRML